MMRNILIPTSYECDTLDAMKIACRLSGPTNNTVVLLSASEISDSIQELLFLSTEGSVDKNKQRKLFDKWTNYSSVQDKCSEMRVREHHQFGITSPIVKALLDRFDIDLVIIPSSVHRSIEPVHDLLVTFLERSKLPVMLLPASGHTYESMMRAMLIGNHKDEFSEAVDNMSLDIVHHMDSDGNDHLLRLLVDALGIELVIQPKGGSQKLCATPCETLGVAVLSV